MYGSLNHEEDMGRGVHIEQRARGERRRVSRVVVILTTNIFMLTLLSGQWHLLATGQRLIWFFFRLTTKNEAHAMSIGIFSQRVRILPTALGE